MRKTSLFLALSIALSLAVAGAAAADDHAVKLAEKGGMGKYLTDAKGMTLYIFKKDEPGKSACTGPCVDRWPLYFREKVAVPGGLKEADFGSITRDDGKKQTTYKGMPLYYFAGDASPGDAKGQAMGGVWYMATPGP